jgi:ethanolamine permease
MITMSVFGAIVMYIISMLSLFRLRKTEPNLERTFRAPGYPLVPGIALFLAVVCLVAMAWFNTVIGLVFLGFMIVGYLYFQLTAKQRSDAPVDAMLTGI